MPLVPDTAEFKFVYTKGTSEFINTIYVRDTIGAWNGTHLAECAENLADAWVTWYIPNMCDDLTFDRVDYKDLGAEFGAVGSFAVSEPGGETEEPAPDQCALLLQLTCAGGAAPRKGSLFLPGLRDDQLDGATNLWSTGIVASVEAAWDALDTALENTEAMVRVSRRNNNAERDPAVTNLINGRTGRRLVASQRDRRPGIGS